ncbi:uncharacterized protein LOC121423700 [Lytechinus variegatus]|uniref:uncharacterized protein LOC121423700 n=1 Tax=Lytechinus variegatus TaxID=7654 RepID=UPI001BB1E74B|nr:uncharacterized protein LOC121423700 [Lytechinus variegatus]
MYCYKFVLKDRTIYPFPSFSSISALFSCPVSNMNVSSDVLCDGVYHCDHYEDELACNYSTTYLQAGDSHSIDISRNYTRRFYYATVLQTNDANGFRIVFQYLYIRSTNQVRIGRGTDPSDSQSVITSLFGTRSSSDDVYVETNNMWIAVIGGPTYTNLEIKADIIAFNLSTLFNCPVSNMNVVSDVLCDGVYDCDHYEDESACNYSTTYLQSGESYSFIIPRNYTIRFYNTTLVQTNDTNGFRIVFQDFFLHHSHRIQIGAGTDPSDQQSVITAIDGYRTCCPVDVYVETNNMWIAVIGGPTYTNLEIKADIIAFNLSKSFHCPVSNRNISVTLACDGYYDCDYFEDELYCDNPVTHLEEGQSHSISTPSFTRELYNTTLLKANTTNGFRIALHRLYLNSYDDEIRIGTGNDPSDIQSIVTTIHGYAYYEDDIYIDTHKMWIVVIGSQQYGHSSYLDLDISITAIDLFNSFPCTSSYMNVSVTLVCDGYYDCDNYEDESLCEYPASFLQKGESYFIYTHNTTRRRSYDTHLLQTDATNGFQIIFRDLYLYYDEQIQIGKGTDPSDLQSVITTIDGYRHCCPSDVYVESSDMWIVIIGGMEYYNLEVYAEIISTDLSTLYRCSISDKFVPTSALCDGFYHCDHFEDELACNHSARFLASGQSTFITPYFVDSGHFGISVLSTNATAIFRLEFQEDHRQNSEETILIGTGNDVKSAIRTFHGHTPYHHDIYLGSNVIWIAIVGHKDYNYYGNYYDSYEGYDSYDYSYDNSDINLKVTAIDRSNLQECGMTGLSFSSNDRCDEVFTCPDFADEEECSHPSIFLLENESYTIAFSDIKAESYNVSLFMANASNGFRIRFLDIYLDCYNYYSYRECDDIIQIGTGYGNANSRSIVKTLRAFTSSEDDVHVDSSEMWISISGIWRYGSNYFYSHGEIEVGTVRMNSTYRRFNKH